MKSKEVKGRNCNVAFFIFKYKKEPVSGLLLFVLFAFLVFAFHFSLMPFTLLFEDQLLQVE